MATNSVIFLRTNWPNFVHKYHVDTPQHSSKLLVNT